jgi:hypothetical protein
MKYTLKTSDLPKTLNFKELFGPKNGCPGIIFLIQKIA